MVKMFNLFNLFGPKFNKKRYFQEMLVDSQKVIADLEFKKFTAMSERESARRQYDQMQDALARMKAKEPKDEKLEGEIATAEKNLKDLESYMKNIDETITGGAPSEALPNGAEGIDNKLTSWVRRREFIKSFITYNC